RGRHRRDAGRGRSCGLRSAVPQTRTLGGLSMNRAIVGFAALMLLGAQSPVWACATCFGDPNDPQTQGMNAAIFTLLGITYGLFLAMFAAGFVIWRRSRNNAHSTPADLAAPESTPEPSHG